jgi:D-threo-aldose 1-dehydrogenase
MRLTRLGRTGLEISEIALGAGDTGGLFIKGDEMTRVIALKRAIGAGVNWIDTAPLYGGGASESTIGRHLVGLSPRPHVSTKVRIEADQMSDIAGTIEGSLEQSLKRLRLEEVSLFQLHNQLGEGVGGRPALTLDQVLGPGGVADTFDRLRDQGLILATGITATGATQACLDVIDSGRFDCAQVYYNAINPSAAWTRTPPGWTAQDFTGVMASCFHADMGTLGIRVWAGGPLASPLRPERLAVLTSGSDLDNEVRCAASVRAAFGTAYGTPAQAALRFTLGNRDLSTRVIGFASLANLEEAIAAVEQGPLPSAAAGKLEELWATDFR